MLTMDTCFGKRLLIFLLALIMLSCIALSEEAIGQCNSQTTADYAWDESFPRAALCSSGTPNPQDPGYLYPGQCVSWVCAGSTENADCTACKTAICNYDDVCSEGETSGSCPNDCYCGNSTCDSDETCTSCESDCGVCPSCASNGQSCLSAGECCSGLCSLNQCIGDISADSNCGNRVIDAGESCANCPSDVKCAWNQKCINGTCGSLNSVKKFYLSVDGNELFATFQCESQTPAVINFWAGNAAVSTFPITCAAAEQKADLTTISQSGVTFRASIQINPLCDVCVMNDYVSIKKETTQNPVPDNSVFSAVLLIVLVLGFITLKKK